MSDEQKTIPDDDNQARPHAFTTKGMPCYEWIDGGRPMTRTQAIEHIRRTRPASLGNETHVSLADAESIEAAPLRHLGEHRAQHSMGDMIKSMMGQSFTFSVPTPREK